MQTGLQHHGKKGTLHAKTQFSQICDGPCRVSKQLLDNYLKSAMLLRVIAANGRCIKMEGGINRESNI